jgi:hypothetical protein
LSAVRIGRLYLSSTLPRVRSQVLISVRGWVHSRVIVGPEG